VSSPTRRPVTMISRSELAAFEARTQLSAELRCSLPFASCYAYAPRATGLLASAARLLCRRVKACDPLWLPRYARCVVELMASEPAFVRLLGRGDAWLIPVPGSTRTTPMYWAAWQLATALQALGAARGVWPGLVREFPVRKSATALLGERPTVPQHYGSLAVIEARAPPGRLILVDDVITRGRTLLAAAARLRRSLPHADIRAFALVRTLGFLDRIDRVLAPCEGVVYWAGGDVRREP